MKRVKVLDDEEWDRLIIKSKNCLMCGIKLQYGIKPNNNGSKHHAILKYLKPKKNVIIPICMDCHRKHHERSKQEPPIHQRYKNVKVRFDGKDGKKYYVWARRYY